MLLLLLMMGRQLVVVMLSDHMAVQRLHCSRMLVMLLLKMPSHRLSGARKRLHCRRRQC